MPRRPTENFSSVELDGSKPYLHITDQSSVRSPSGKDARGVESDAGGGFDSLKYNSITQDEKEPFNFEKNGDITFPGEEGREASRFKNYEAFTYRNSWQGNKHYLRGKDNQWNEVSAKDYEAKTQDSKILNNLSDRLDHDNNITQMQATAKEVEFKTNRTPYENELIHSVKRYDEMQKGKPTYNELKTLLNDTWKDHYEQKPWWQKALGF